MSLIPAASNTRMLGLIAAITLLDTGFVFCQTQIEDPAPISIENGSLDCSGMARVVDVYVDVTGLSGTGGDAGLNGFVLVLDLICDNGPCGNIFASALPGNMPDVDWVFSTTRPEYVTLSGRLVLVGGAADLDAPNTRYHVAKILFSNHNSHEAMQISLDRAASSLASTVVDGHGPGPIPIGADTIPLNVTLPLDFPLAFMTGVSLWLQVAWEYDLVPYGGFIDMLDLVKLINCGAQPFLD